MTVEAPVATLRDYLERTGTPWSEEDIVSSVDHLIGPRTGRRTVSLPERERALWARYAGVSGSDAVEPVVGDLIARADRRSVTETVASSITALTADEVGCALGLKASTIRHYRADGRLYAYSADGKSRFPAWQFTVDRSAAIPGLAEVLASLSTDLHPRSVEGFFVTPQSELVLGEVPVSPRDWLQGGGDPREVSALAAEVGQGH